MNNVRPSGPQDEPSDFEGDSAFFGVEERLPAQSVPPGQMNGAKNCRFRNSWRGNGRAETREGIGLLPWMKGNGLTPFSEVYGAGVFRDPNTAPPATGDEWILMGAEGAVWRTKPNYVARAMPFGDPVPLSQATYAKLLQAGGAVLLLRGLGNAVLQCTNLEEGFKPIVQQNQWSVTFAAATNRVGLPNHNLVVGDPVRFTAVGGSLPVAITAGVTYYVLDTPDNDTFRIAATPGGTQVTWNTSPTDATVYVSVVTVLDGAVPIPPASDGLYFNNRVLLITGKDQAVISDIGDFTRYQPATEQFRINLGDADTLLSVALFNEDTVVFFKQGRVLKVTGVSGDLTQALGPLNVTEQYGGLGVGSVAAYGNDLYWLSSELRVTSLTLTALNQEQGTDKALSDPLVQTFGRVARQYASAARVTVWEGFLFCALPLDDANVVSTLQVVPSGLNYVNAATAVVISGLTAGKTYHYAQGSNDASLVNGTETLPGDADFIAQGTTVSLYGVAAGPVGASVKQVLASGVNTGVAVYDFENQLWCGSDEAVPDGPYGPGGGIAISVKDWLKFRYGGQTRLGFLGSDGWLHVYNEGFEDEVLQVVAAPYVDVLADRLSLLTVGKSIQVNGGTLVTATLAAGNTGTTWGTGFGNARANLWTDTLWGFGGPSPGGPPGGGTWSAPNTVATLIDEGVRFTATNGVLPQVKINGVVVTNGFSDWALLDSHQGSEIISTDIVSYGLTRGYRCQEPDMRRALYLSQNIGTKRFLGLGLQLATWSPSYSMRLLVQGVNTGDSVVSAETRDRLQYFAPVDASPWVPTNANDDYDAPRRQDYSFAMGEPFINLALVLEASGLFLNSGCSVNAVQEAVHRTPLDNERGLWAQVEIINRGGRMELLAAAMEGQDGEVLSGPTVG